MLLSGVEQAVQFSFFALWLIRRGSIHLVRHCDDRTGEIRMYQVQIYQLQRDERPDW